jgi:hypothetical protein
LLALFATGVNDNGGKFGVKISDIFRKFGFRFYSLLFQTHFYHLIVAGAPSVAGVSAVAGLPVADDFPYRC